MAPGGEFEDKAREEVKVNPIMDRTNEHGHCVGLTTADMASASESSSCPIEGQADETEACLMEAIDCLLHSCD